MVRRVAITGVGWTAAVLLAALIFLASGMPLVGKLPGAVVVTTLTYARLGVGDGWQCLSSGSISYVPGRDAPDRTLLAELPEVAAARLAGPSFVAEEVEVWPVDGVAMVRGSVPDPSTGMRPRSIVLSAGSERLIDAPGGGTVHCLGLGGWRAGMPR
jgi:hypothetical protein